MQSEQLTILQTILLKFSTADNHLIKLTGLHYVNDTVNPQVNTKYAVKTESLYT